MTFNSDEISGSERILQKAKIRITGQRLALLSVLRTATDHPDAEELFARTKKIEPKVSLATVYRTLGLLADQGIIHRHKFEGGGARFEIATEDHHDHIVDLDSGKVIEFNSEQIEQLQNEIAAKFGYDVIHHRMELYCRKHKV